jgi:hypothetical protein
MLEPKGQNKMRITPVIAAGLIVAREHTGLKPEQVISMSGVEKYAEIETLADELRDKDQQISVAYVSYLQHKGYYHYKLNESWNEIEINRTELLALLYTLRFNFGEAFLSVKEAEQNHRWIVANYDTYMLGYKKSCLNVPNDEYQLESFMCSYEIHLRLLERKEELRLQALEEQKAKQLERKRGMITSAQILTVLIGVFAITVFGYTFTNLWVLSAETLLSLAAFTSAFVHLEKYKNTFTE